MAKSPSMQVFQMACDHLGTFLKTYGFKYLKSKRNCTRQGSLFEHVIGFGTHRSTNALGGVALDVHAEAWSKQLADYRHKAGIDLPINEAVLFGTDIENIFHPAPPYVRYDIGDPRTRDEILTNIKTVLQRDVLRAFDIVEDPLAFRGAVKAKLLPCLWNEAIRDYSACFPIHPTWLTQTVISLAQAILDERAYDRLPIWADALEDAGYTNAEILSRCRKPTVKGPQDALIEGMLQDIGSQSPHR